MQHWLGDLNENIRKLNARIHESVDNLQESITKRVNEEVAEAIKSGRASVVDGNNVVINSNAGVSFIRTPGHSKSISTGVLPNGQPYRYEVEDQQIGRTVIHTERYFNGSSDGVQVVGYSINLDDPHAIPVPLKLDK